MKISVERSQIQQVLEATGNRNVRTSCDNRVKMYNNNHQHPHFSNNYIKSGGTQLKLGWQMEDSYKKQA